MNCNTKICTWCGIEKDLSDYYLHNKTKKHISKCKKCVMKSNVSLIRKKRGHSIIIDLPDEEWRWVIGFENYYMVSSLGRIKGVERWITDSLGFSRLKRAKLLSGSLNEDLYLKYTLSKDGECFTVLGNQIVGKAFVVNPRPDIYFQTNHKNAIRSDNRYVNIEWCDADYNNNYKYDVLGYTYPKGEHHWLSKKITVIYPDGKEESIIGILEASRKLNLPKSCIGRVLRSESDEYKGYKFKYAS